MCSSYSAAFIQRIFLFESYLFSQVLFENNAETLVGRRKKTNLLSFDWKEFKIHLQILVNLRDIKTRKFLSPVLYRRTEGRNGFNRCSVGLWSYSEYRSIKKKLLHMEWFLLTNQDWGLLSFHCLFVGSLLSLGFSRIWPLVYDAV